MGYTPTEWVNGDVITAEKLNKLENGVASVAGGADGVIVAPEQNVTLDDSGDAAEISIDEGYVLPEMIPSNWLVTVNGLTLPYDNQSEYYFTVDSNGYRYEVSYYDNVASLYVSSVLTWEVVAGTYSVSIYEKADDKTAVPEFTSQDINSMLCHRYCVKLGGKTYVI